MMDHLKRILARQVNGEFPNSGQLGQNQSDNPNNPSSQPESIINKLNPKTPSADVTIKFTKGELPDPYAKKVTCAVCQDKGILLDEDEIARPCRCMKQKALLNLFKSAQLSKDMMKSNFKNFSSNYYSKDYLEPISSLSSYTLAERAFLASKRFVKDFLEDNEPDGLLFSGSVGCGKTYLACCIANALLEHGVEVLFLVVPDLLDEIKATYDPNGGTNTEHDLLEAARKVPVLILDDLGAHNYTDWVRNKIYSIINYRLNNQLPTVITTNLTLNDLNEFLGERTTSRIIQMCQSYLIMVKDDIRVAKRREKQT
jgi:DNA replication protein DnaC